MVKTEYKTIVEKQIDTLVIVQEYDSVPASTRNNMFYVSGSETRPIELFKDGKRIDTIFKHTVIYY